VRVNTHRRSRLKARRVQHTRALFWQPLGHHVVEHRNGVVPT
jgi:hypothetical protein